MVRVELISVGWLYNHLPENYPFGRQWPFNTSDLNRGKIFPFRCPSKDFPRSCVTKLTGVPYI